MDIRFWAQRTPSKTAVVCGDTQVSYAELEALANRFADLFRTCGLRRSEHIASFLPNRPEALAVAWAAYRTGLYLTPLPTTLAVREAAYLLENSDARLLIADASLDDLASQLPALAARPTTWLALGGEIRDFERVEPLLAAASTEACNIEPPGALMVYTSGTTGAPKGVWRPLPPPDFKGIPPFAADLLKLFDLAGPEVRYLSTAPLYHSAPLRFALAVTAGGGTVFLMEKFDATFALDLLEREGITHSQWVPTMFQRLLALPQAQRAAFKAPAHRAAIHGAAPCPPALKQAMNDWWGPILLEYYSGSEGIGLTLIDAHEALRKPGSVGRARKGTAHVLAEDGRELPPGERGVIYFSGVAPFAYYNDPAKTATRTNSQNWQTFGDIGYLDGDGYLYLTDRQDDVIVSGGVNLYPQEIERVIGEVAGVSECAVVGVPDDDFGERAVAFVVPARNRSDAPTPLLAAIDEYVRQHLGRLKRPSEIRFIEALPRSPAGKVLRRALREFLTTS